MASGTTWIPWGLASVIPLCEHSDDSGQALLGGLRRALRTRQSVLINF